EIDRLATKTFSDLSEISKSDHADNLSFADVIEDVWKAQTTLGGEGFKLYRDKLDQMIDRAPMAQIHIIGIDKDSGKLWVDVPQLAMKGRYNACSWIDAIIPNGSTETKAVKVPPCPEDARLKKP